MPLDPQFAPSVEIETFLVSLIGTLAIVLSAGLLAALARSAAWRRAAWQVSTLGMLLLVIGESTGLGSFVASVRVRSPQPEQFAIPDANQRATSAARDGVTASIALDDWQSTGPIPLYEARSSVPAESGREIPSDIGLADTPLAPIAAVPEPAQQLRFGTWLLAFWLAGGAFAAMRLAWRRWQLWRRTREAPRVDDPQLLAGVQRLAAQMGVRRPIRVIQSSLFPAPATYGLLRPTIVLPAGFSTAYDGRQRDVMLAHELAHIAAWDALWLLLADGACILLWWHRLAWWSRARLRAACESLADEASLHIPDGPEVLAECLVALGRDLADRPQLAWLSIEGSRFRSGLGRRIERLLALDRRSPRGIVWYRHALAKSGLMIVLVVATFLTTAWARPQATLVRGETHMNVLRLSWQRSLAAAIATSFLAVFPGDARTAESEEVPAPPQAAVAEQPPHEGVRVAQGPRDEGAVRELRERAGAIERELRELGDRHRDRAEALERELNGIRQRIEQSRPREGVGAPPRPEAVMRELEERIGATERALHELGDGLPDKAEALKRELNAMREKMQQLRRQGHPEERPRPERAIGELEERAGVLERELRELGDRHPDRSEAVERELKEIRQRLQKLRELGEGPRPPAEGAIRELRERAANIERELRELGDNHPDRVEALGHELRSIHEKMRRLLADAGPGGPPPMARPLPPRAPGDAMPAIEELRGQMRAMRQEMEALRAEVRRLLEREAREREERR
ncbi:MAG: hypothetical protein KJZ87_17965 [Thermoguttaceae bacterium]|nr:hypothetical protein [Thermoguttaceae bacterium]